jgi:hypothetical protein
MRVRWTIKPGEQVQFFLAEVCEKDAWASQTSANFFYWYTIDKSPYSLKLPIEDCLRPFSKIIKFWNGGCFVLGSHPI